jgi:PBSX family phage terminase large subunit
MEIIVEKLPQFDILYNLPAGTNTVVLIGGRGGAKTYEVSKFVAFMATVKKKRCVVLRDEKELIRESILNEILMRFDTADANGQLSQFYERLDTGLKDRRTNEMTVFTKGFRASTTDKKANLKSISNIDIAVIEEAEDIRDVDKYNTFADGIRKEGALIVIILNTPDLNHWIIKRFFTLDKVDDGYYDIIPKQIPGFVCIKTSFEQNPYLPVSIVDNYNNYGNPDSHLFNPHYFLTAIKGYASTGRKGQIFSNWKPITNQEFNEIDARSIFGQDFGTSSPAALVEAKLVNNRLYLREQNYKPLTEKELGMMYCRLQLKDEVIIADCAEPMTIRRLRTGWQASELTPAELEQYPQLLKGWNVYGAIKAKGSINSGIGKIMDMEVFVTEGSTNLWEEYAHYVWAMDKNGLPTDEPEDAYNHGIDCARYIITGKGRYF